MPDAVGVPLMVMMLADQTAETPAGKPSVPELPPDMPVAPVVAMVILPSAVLIHSVGVDDGLPAVLAGVTVIVPVALTLLQPPVKGML